MALPRVLPSWPSAGPGSGVRFQASRFPSPFFARCRRQVALEAEADRANTPTAQFHGCRPDGSGRLVVKCGDLVTVGLQGDYGKPQPALVIQSDQFPGTAAGAVSSVTSTLVDAPLLHLSFAGVSRWTIMRTVKSGDLPAIRDNRKRWRIARNDLDTWRPHRV